MELDYRRIALGGALSTGLGQVARIAFQAAALVLLARLLSPADFGVAAMVLPILSFATILQEAGLGAALIQRKSVTPAELATLFWVNAGIGLLLCAALILLAPVAASFFREPRVEGLMVASGPLVLVAALGSQPVSLLNRDMRYGALAIIDVAAQGAGFVVGVAVAVATRSYWALWLAPAAVIACSSLSAWFLTRAGLTRPAPLRAVRDMLGFGAHLTVNNVFIYVGRNLDSLLIGRRWGEVSLGYYDRAYKLMMMPLLMVSSPLQRLVVPILARTVEEPDRHRRFYLTTLQILLVGVAPGMAALVAAPATGMLVILGPGWEETARIFQWLGLAALVQLVTNSFGWLYIGQGRPRDMMLAGLATTCWTAAAFVVGLPWGARGVALAYALSESVRLPVACWWVTRRGPVRGRDLAGAVLPFVPAVLIGIAAAGSVDRLAHASPWAGLLGATAACYACAWSALLLSREGRVCLARAVQLVRGVAADAARRLAPA